jgi:NADH-quinone oxidoreductase subunit I
LSAGIFKNVAKPILSGFGITFKRLRHKNVTVGYPEQLREQYPRTRWRHYLTRYENGLEKCIGCSLCAGACPARCIYVEAAENTDDARFSPGERYAARYEINMIRCIFCGYCQDACPTGAIILRKDFELASYKREDFIYTKERLLEKYAGESDEPFLGYKGTKTVKDSVKRDMPEDFSVADRGPD